MCGIIQARSVSVMHCKLIIILSILLQWTSLLASSELVAGEDLDIPQQPGSANGLWEQTAHKREEEALAVRCRGAEPETATTLVKEMAKADKQTQAVFCLEEALKVHPEDTGLLATRGQLAQPKQQAVLAEKSAAAPSASPTHRLLLSEQSEDAGAVVEQAAEEQEALRQSNPEEGNSESGGLAEEEAGAESGGESGPDSAKESEKEAGKEAEEAPPAYLVGVGYVHSVKDDDKLIDKQFRAAHNDVHTSLQGTLHLLDFLSPDDSAKDSVLDGSYSTTLDEERYGLLGGYSFGKGEVSYKTMLGFAYDRLLEGENELGGQARYLLFSGAKDLGLNVHGKLHFFEVLFAVAQLDYLLGKLRGAAATGRLGYEAHQLEALIFATKGHGMPSHSYLRPEGDDVFITVGAELESHLTKEWMLSLGIEQRREPSGKELELSAGVAWGK